MEKEKIRVRDLPDEFRPIGAWAYVGYNILFSLPIVGFFAIIICASCAHNINVRKYAGSFIIAFVLGLILIVALIILFYSQIESLINEFISRYEQFVRQTR